MLQLENLSEDEMCQFLAEAISEKIDQTDDAREDTDPENFQRTRSNIRTFEEMCFLTEEKGLVVRIGDTEYHIRVQRMGTHKY